MNNNTDRIRKEITVLFHTAPQVRVTVRQNRPKLMLSDLPVQIVGVYENLFRVKDVTAPYPKYYTFSYADVWTGAVIIKR